MKVSPDCICAVCRKVFCCRECCHKHYVKNHAIIAKQVRILPLNDDNDNELCDSVSVATAEIYLFCPICEKKPLLLHKLMYNEMLKHVEDNHLPLHCRKCAKVYTKIEDMREFSKCLSATMGLCSANEYEDSFNTHSSKTTLQKALKSTISTQTSPMPQMNDLNETHMITPISLMNLNWKAKSKVTHEEFISDSVSSIKNLSSINNSTNRRSLNGVEIQKPKGSLVRTTSTPVHAELIYFKPKEQTFNASGGQVSSIYNSGCESDNSPAVPNSNVGTSPKQTMEGVNRYLKIGARGKMSAVTPLRQVMSKSIQKAFAEHGFVAPTTASGGNGVGAGIGGNIHNRKKIFESDSFEACVYQTSGGSPLDLRLSPALRRTQSDVGRSISHDTEHATRPLATTSSSSSAVLSSSFDRIPKQFRREIMVSSKKLTSESIVITRTQGMNSICANNMEPASNSSASASAASASSSIYKTCRSVEIITSTTSEMSEINIQEDEACASKEHADVLHPLHSLPQQYCNTLNTITPISRMSGPIINKKIIHFDTPNFETEISPNCNQSTNDVFYTPISTPVRKKTSTNAPRDSAKKRKENSGVAPPRILSQRFSPSRRPPIRDCARQTAFTRIEVMDGNSDDEVFEESHSKTTELEKENSAPDSRQAKQAVRSWSLGSLMSTVMRLPSLIGNDRNEKKCNNHSPTVNNNAGSLIKRCASIAGSLVRAKPDLDEEQINNLKRKRTYTLNSVGIPERTCSDSLSPNADTSTVSSKRFRIHGRRPIERMRRNT